MHTSSETYTAWSAVQFFITVLQYVEQLGVSSEPPVLELLELEVPAPLVPPVSSSSPQPTPLHTSKATVASAPNCFAVNMFASAPASTLRGTSLVCAATREPPGR